MQNMLANRILVTVVVIIVVAELSVLAFSEVTRVSPAEAMKHLVKNPAPVYPAIAQAGRIQGNVILQITVDEYGAASVVRVVRGHPMLVPAAVDAVNHWKYRPFEFGGRPVAIATLTIVRFGNPVNHDAEDAAELQFQHSFWLASEAADTALVKKDYSGAEAALKHASDLLRSSNSLPYHVHEQSQLLNDMGDVRRGQQNYTDSEQYYRNALALHKGEKDSPEAAASLAGLAFVFAAQGKFEGAREYVGRSVAVYRRIFKQVSPTHPARGIYGRAIAVQSLMLLDMATKKKDVSLASQQCHVLMEFQNYLQDSEREPLMTHCQ